MKEENIHLQTKNGIGLLLIRRPQQLNALNIETIEELHQRLNILEKDNNIKVLILSGEGVKAFAAGAEIKEIANFSKKQGKELARTGQEKLFNKIENFTKPVIAVIPGYGGTQRLSQLVGKGKAFEMILSAKMINTQDALKWGLINYEVKQESLLAKCNEIAEQIIKNSPKAIQYAIKSINAGFNHELNGFQVEIDSFGDCFKSEEFVEGTNAFLEKRKPKF